MTVIADTMDKLVEKYFCNETKSHTCSSAVLLAMCEYYGIESPLIPAIAKPFGGGLAGTHRSVCGGISGGLMTLGLMESDDPAALGRELLDFITEKYGSYVCDKILDIDFDNPAQVESEKAPKKNSICTPMLKDICVWIAERLDKLRQDR